MRTTTTAQKRAITGPANIRLRANSGSGHFYYISTPGVSGYESNDPILEAVSFSTEIGWLGGIGTVSDLDLVVNNFDLASDLLDSTYLDNTNVAVTLFINSMTFVIYTGIIDDFSVDHDEFVLNVVDNAIIYDIPLLEPVANDDVPDDSNATFYPICYFSYGDGEYKNPMPMVNVLGGSNKYILGNHPIANVSDGPFVYQYSDGMGEYVRFTDRATTDGFTSEPSYTRIQIYKGQLGTLLHTNRGFRNAIAGAQNTTGDLTEVFDKDDTNYVSMGASENLAIKFELEDLGEIRATNDVSFYIINSNRSGTVTAAIVDSTGSTIYSSTINLDNFTFQNWAGHIFTFQELSSTYELVIQTAAASACRVYYVELEISEFAFYRAKRVPLNVRT